MKRKLVLVFALSAAALLIVSAVVAGSPVGTDFTYQGFLKSGGTPATGAFDFEFRLFDTATGGAQVGSLVAHDDVTVTNGLFVVQLDFGADAFSGDARWLEIAVSADRTTISPTLLVPRQALTPIPYALHAGNADTVDGLHASDLLSSGAGWALTGNAGTDPATNFIGTTDAVTFTVRANNAPVLQLVPNATSPNLIGGYSGNWITPGVFGAVINGGGQNGYFNRVTDHLGVIGGGHSNQAGNDDDILNNAHFATVAGGLGNTASGTFSVIAGGRNNVAGSSYAFVGGGLINQATGADYGYATVAGGWGNIAAGDLSFIGGGASNEVHGGFYNAIASGYRNLITTTTDTNTEYTNFIGGGFGNVISGTMGYATIGGGRQNTAGGGYATVAGGWGNTAGGYGSAVTGGFSANASHHGEQAHASGLFAAAGDAQASDYVLRRVNAMAAGTWHDLFLDGTSQRLTIAAGRTVTFDILISGRTEGGESAGYRIEGLIENVGGTTALVGAPTITTLGEDDAAWNVQVLASAPQDALLIQVQGNGETIRWVARVETVEVSW
jgi:hypothetical protein